MFRKRPKLRFFSELSVACGRSVQYNTIFLGEKVRHVIFSLSKPENYTVKQCKSIKTRPCGVDTTQWFDIPLFSVKQKYILSNLRIFQPHLGWKIRILQPGSRWNVFLERNNLTIFNFRNKILITSKNTLSEYSRPFVS